MKNDKARTDWFKQARFGMFIHWGDYSVLGRGEWVMWQEQIPPEKYAKYADQFKPTKYNPETWAALAKEAGMKYMVLTTRHHDGYCLFNTATTKFNAAQTGPGRDLIAPYVKACRKAGLKVGLYYSLGDWRNPDFWKHWTTTPKKGSSHWDQMVANVHAQVRELCTNYGQIDLIWYDGGFFPQDRTLAEAYDSKRLNAMIRRLQPQIIINNRSGLPEDFDTPEGHITASLPGRLWESCMTHNKHWAYFADDDLFRPARSVVIDITACAWGGGNYLLNVGPKPDGTIPAPSVKMLKEVGGWMRRNGEAIYGSERCEVTGAAFGVTTAKPGRIYLLVHWWPGTELKVPGAGIKPRKAWILSTKKPVKFRVQGKDLFFTGLPAQSPEPMTTVIGLEM